MTRYRVSEGERLSAIAKHFNTTTDAIVDANPARSHVLLTSGERVFADLAGGDEIDIPMLGEPKTVDASNAVSCSIYSASAIWDSASQQCFASGADMEEYYKNLLEQQGAGGSGGSGSSTDTNPSKTPGGGSYGGAKSDTTMAAQPIERSSAITAGLSLVGGLLPAAFGAVVGLLAAGMTAPKSMATQGSDSDAVYAKKKKALHRRAGIGAAIGGGVGLVGGSAAAYMLLQKTRKAAELA